MTFRNKVNLMSIHLNQRELETLDPEPEEEMAAPTRRGSMDLEEERVRDGVDVPVPDDGFFGDTVLFHEGFRCQDYCWEIDVTPAGDLSEACDTPDAFVLAAVSERKKRTEIKLKELSQEDQKRFAVAKHKELRAWLQHRTIRKLREGFQSTPS